MNWRTTVVQIIVVAIFASVAVSLTLWLQRPYIPPPPSPPGETPPSPSYPPEMAIVKVIMNDGYCSGTIIRPQRSDKRWHVISASHCFRGVNESVRIQFRDGKTFSAYVIAIDRKCDGAILLTEPITEVLPSLELASKTPKAGVKIWHAGFGFDKPGNREEGKLLGGPDSNGQNKYWLNVSNGDSGGGICLDQENRLLSPVCCTTRIAQPANVWGAAPEALHRMLAQPTRFDELVPKQMPIRKEEE